MNDLEQKLTAAIKTRLEMRTLYKQASGVNTNNGANAFMRDYDAEAVRIVSAITPIIAAEIASASGVSKDAKLVATQIKFGGQKGYVPAAERILEAPTIKSSAPAPCTRKHIHDAMKCPQCGTDTVHAAVNVCTSCKNISMTNGWDDAKPEVAKMLARMAPASKEVEVAIYNLYSQVEEEDAGFVHDINVLVSAIRHAPESVNLPDIGTETLEKHPSYKVKTFKSGGEIVMEIPDQNDPNSSMVCLLSDTPTQLLAQQQTIDELKVHILSASAPESVNRELMDLIKQQVKREKVSMHLSDCGCFICQMEVAISRASTAVASEDTRDKTIAEYKVQHEADKGTIAHHYNYAISLEAELKTAAESLARKTAERDTIDAEHRDCGKKLFDLRERLAGTEKTYLMQSERVKEMEKELSAVNATLAKLTDEMEGDVRTAIESVPGIDALHVNTRGQICRAVLRVYRAARSAAERKKDNGPGADSSQPWTPPELSEADLAEIKHRTLEHMADAAKLSNQVVGAEPLTDRPSDNDQSAVGVTRTCPEDHEGPPALRVPGKVVSRYAIVPIPTIAGSSDAIKSSGPVGIETDNARRIADLEATVKELQASSRHL